jgi:hypothetical protein
MKPESCVNNLYSLAKQLKSRFNIHEFPSVVEYPEADCRASALGVTRIKPGFILSHDEITGKRDYLTKRRCGIGGVW